MVVMVTVAVPLGGCQQTYKNGSDIQALQDFKIEKGKTTEQELISRLGEPASTMDRGDGTIVLTWSGAQGTTNGTGPLGSAFLSMVPGGILLAHDDMKMQSQSLQVTVKDGIVIDYTILSANQNIRMY
jgi:hypothetical protein